MKQILMMVFILLLVNVRSTGQASGLSNYIPKFTSTTTFGNSTIYESGTNVGIGTTLPQSKLHIQGNGTTNGAPVMIMHNAIATGLVGGLRFTSGYNSFDSWSGIEAYGTGGADQQDLRFYTTYGTRNERLRIDQFGWVGIGTTAPTAKLSILGGGIRADFNALGISLVLSGTNSSFQVIHSASTQNVGVFNSNGGVDIRKPDGITNIASFNWNGNVYCNNKMYIGTPDANTESRITNYTLAVNGNAIFNKAKVMLYGAPWADYVFDEKYNLLPLADLEKFIPENKHLPDVPTSSEVEKEGIDIIDTQIVLL